MHEEHISGVQTCLTKIIVPLHFCHYDLQVSFSPWFLGPKSQKKFKRLMLHRIKWEEHNSKRDGKSGFSCQSLLVFMPLCSFLGYWTFYHWFPIRPRCWWWYKKEQQVLVDMGGECPHVLLFATGLVCYLNNFWGSYLVLFVISFKSDFSWFSRAQLKSAVLGRWSSSNAPQRAWPENTSRNTAQNTTGI